MLSGLYWKVLVISSLYSQLRLRALYFICILCTLPQCMSYLLLHNKFPKIQWIKIMLDSVLTISVGSEFRISLAESS